MKQLRQKIFSLVVYMALIIPLILVFKNSVLNNKYNAATVSTVTSTSGTSTYVDGNYTYTFKYTIGDTSKTASNELNTCTVTNVTIKNGNTNAYIPLNAGMKLKYNSKEYVLRITEYGDGINSVITNNSSKDITTLRLGRYTAKINKNAFKNESSLQTVVCYYSSANNDFSSLTHIGDYAFYNSTSLKQFGKTAKAINIPATCSYIGEYTFYEAGNAYTAGNGVSKINIQSTVDITIENNAFQNVKTVQEVIIPKTCTKIGNYSFEGCSGLKTLSLKNNGTSTDIGDYAFANCTLLSNIRNHSANYYCSGGCGTTTTSHESSSCKGNITDRRYKFSSSIKSVGKYAFSNCTSLGTLTANNNLQTIGEGAFSGCTKLNTFTLGTGTTSIGIDAFKDVPLATALTYNAINCTAYSDAFTGKQTTTVTVGSTVTYLPDNFIKGNTKVATITIPNTCTKIGSNAFSGCTAVTTATIGTGVTEIGVDAFKDVPLTTKLTWNAINCTTYNDAFTGKAIPTVVIGSTVQRIPDNFLASSTVNASSLKTVGATANNIIIPASVTYIGDYAFKGATTPTVITINSSTEGTTIGKSAFSGCTAVTTATIGTGVTEIGVDAFKDVPLTTKLTWNAINCTTYNNAFTGKQIVTIVIGSTVQRIPNYFIKGNYSATNIGASGTITLPSSLAYIGAYSFYGCENSSIKKISIPSGKINAYAFYDCKNITTTTLGEDVTINGDYAFGGTTPIGALSINSSLGTKYGSSVFKQKTGITSVSIGSTCYSLYSNMFQGCTGITKLTIAKNGICTIPSYCFDGCTQLQSSVAASSPSPVNCLSIPADISSIGDYAFRNCTNLKRVGYLYTDDEDTKKWANSFRNVSSIGSYAFSGTGITVLETGNNVSKIGSYAFYNCPNLTKTTLGRNVYSVQQNAFGGSTPVGELTLNSGIGSTYASSLFKGNKGIKSVSVNTGSYKEDGDTYYYSGELYPYMFQDCTGITKITIKSNDDVGIVSIPKYCFAGCTGITNITTPDGLWHGFEDYAFYNCTGLTKVTINNSSAGGMKEFNFGAHAFDGCTNLTAFYNGSTANTIGTDVIKIGDYAFANCSLNSLTIAGTPTIGNYFLKNNTAIKTLYIKNSAIFSVNSITGSNINELKFNKNIPNHNGAFANQPGITTLHLNEGVTEIYDGMFKNDTGLTKVNIDGSNITAVGAEAFLGCIKITSKTAFDYAAMDSTLQNVGKYAFRFQGYPNTTGAPEPNVSISQTNENVSGYYPNNGINKVTMNVTATDTSINDGQDYIFCIDVTGSLDEKVTCTIDGVTSQQTLYKLQKLAMKTFTDTVYEENINNRIAIVTFKESSTRLFQDFTDGNNKSAMDTALSKLPESSEQLTYSYSTPILFSNTDCSGTDYWVGLQGAFIASQMRNNDFIANSNMQANATGQKGYGGTGGGNRNTNLIFISDGEPTHHQSSIEASGKIAKYGVFDNVWSIGLDISGQSGDAAAADSRTKYLQYINSSLNGQSLFHDFPAGDLGTEFHNFMKQISLVSRSTTYDMKLTNEINTNIWDILPSSESYPWTSGVTYSGNKVYVNAETTTSGVTESYDFYVKLKESYKSSLTQKGTYNPNLSKSLDATYKISGGLYSGEERTKSANSLNATWYVYSLTVNPNGGTYSGSSPVSKSYGYTTSLSTPTKTGYTFKNWSLSGGGSVSGSTYTFGTSDATVTAQWTPNTYKMQFNYNGGASGAVNTALGYKESNPHTGYTETETSGDIPYGAEHWLSDPTRKGYRFTGWSITNSNTSTRQFYDTNSGTWEVNTDASIKTSGSGYTGTFKTTGYKRMRDTNGIVVFKANWTPRTYTNTLNYDANGGTGAPAAQTTSVTYPNTSSSFTVSTTKPTRAGYIFDGWYTAPTGGEKVGPTYTVGKTDNAGNQSATIYAHWTENSYTITYNLNGGTVAKANPTSYKITTETFTLNNPTKTGYTFTGWTGSNGTTAQTSVSIVKGSTGNKSYIANWKAAPYTNTLKYDANGGSGAPAAQTASVTYPNTSSSFTVSTTKPTRTGYKFVGWYTSAEGGTEVGATHTVGNKDTASNQSITIYAHWTPNTYTNTLNYNANGGSGKPASQTATVTYPNTSSTFTVSTVKPTREGYIFVGWYTSAEGGTKVDTTHTVGKANNAGNQSATIYAHWTVSTATVHYVDVVNTVNGTELGSVTGLANVGTTVNGDDTLIINNKETIRNSTADNAYYNGYYLTESTSATVTIDGATVYRIFKLRTIDIEGSVEWKDKSNKHGTRPDSVTITIYRDGIKLDSVKGFTDSDINTFSFTGLDKYNKTNGEPYEYTVTQSEAVSKSYPEDFYETSPDTYKEISNKDFKFINELDSTTFDNGGLTINGNIYWEDESDKLAYRPNTVTINLYQNGILFDSKEVDSFTENAYSFTEVPKYDSELEKYTYTVEEIVAATYLNQNYEEKDAYKIYPDTPNKLDFTNVCVVSGIIIPTQKYNHSLIVKTNTEKDMFVTLKALEVYVNNDLSVSYKNTYSGIEYNIMANEIGSLLQNIIPGKYEIMVPSDDMYIFKNMNFSTDSDNVVSYVSENGKEYLIINIAKKDTESTLTLNFDKKTHMGYQTDCDVYNYWNLPIETAPTTNTMSLRRMFSSEEIVAEDIEYFHITYENSSTVDEEDYQLNDKARIKDFVSSNNDTLIFKGWSLEENSNEIIYLPYDTVLITENIILYPVFEENDTEIEKIESVEETLIDDLSELINHDNSETELNKLY